MGGASGRMSNERWKDEVRNGLNGKEEIESERGRKTGEEYGDMGEGSI